MEEYQLLPERGSPRDHLNAWQDPRDALPPGNYDLLPQSS